MFCEHDLHRFFYQQLEPDESYHIVSIEEFDPWYIDNLDNPEIGLVDWSWVERVWEVTFEHRGHYGHLVRDRFLMGFPKPELTVINSERNRPATPSQERWLQHLREQAEQ